MDFIGIPLWSWNVKQSKFALKIALKRDHTNTYFIYNAIKCAPTLEWEYQIDITDTQVKRDCLVSRTRVNVHFARRFNDIGVPLECINKLKRSREFMEI